MTVDANKQIFANLAETAKAAAAARKPQPKADPKEKTPAPAGDVFEGQAAPEKAAAPKKSAKAPKAVKTEEAKAPEAPAAEKPVKINYLPQDPGMLPLEQTEMILRPDVSNDRFRVSESPTFKQPKPDAQGNFLYTPDDTRFDGINSMFIANQTLNIAENYAGRELPWSFGKELGREQLLIHPHLLANEANAFYSSETGSVNLSYYLNQQGETERTGTQADVVSHEAGHAILDAMRPTWLHSMSVASGGFHEAFGDMISILRALNDAPIIPVLKAETNGELRIPNIVSSVGEQIGTAIYGEAGGKHGLRSALNNTKYADAAFLPFVDRDGSHAGLGTEPHAYSKLFTGAFYDILTGMFDEAHSSPDASFRQATQEAADSAGKLLMRAIDFSPVGDITYKDMAESFLRADMIDNGGKNLELLATVFAKRNILTPEQSAAALKRDLNVPALRYSDKLEKGETALKYVDKNREALGIPADVKFEYQGVKTTKTGERFVTLTTNRDTDLKGKEWGLYEDCKVRVNGGLLLAFGADGSLTTSVYDAVTDDELEDVQLNFRHHVQGGSLVEGNGTGNDKNLNRLHIQTLSEGSSRVIRRAPVVYCGGEVGHDHDHDHNH